MSEIQVTPTLLSKKDVCARLGLSVRTLENKVRDGEFPRPVQLGRSVYWSEKAVAQWVNRLFHAQEAWRPGGLTG